jgi:putative spermidine/putrescine transport system permease protein
MTSKIGLWVTTTLTLAVIYVPILVVVLNSFSTSRTLAWPPPGFTTEWWGKAFANAGALSAISTSLIVAAVSTLIALLLGTALSFALHRFDFFGKSTVNLLVVLPIALPGIVTGIALNNAFRTMLGMQLGWFTIIVAHATFCVVTVFNNVFAGLRRVGTSLEEASSDLGAGIWTTFRLVTFPQIRSALFAGGLLSFALSFDEIIVTTFTAGSGVQTLPIFILDNMFRPNQAPIVAVVAVVMIIIAIVPIYIAQRLTTTDNR